MIFGKSSLIKNYNLKTVTKKMRHYKVLDVKTVDFTTFENFPGGAEFESEFRPFAKEDSRFTYKFYNDADLALAEKSLVESNLEYSLFYGSEVESDDDIKGHPAFFISFRSDYNTGVKKGNDFFIDSKKMGKRNFQKDLTEDVWIFTKKGMAFFQEEIPGITFEKISDLAKKTDYYKVNFPELGFPITYTNGELKEAHHVKGKYSVWSDGRTALDDEAKQQLKINKLSLSKTFRLAENIYPDVLSIIIISGDFAFKLKQTFNFKANDIKVTPIYFE